jgi:amino acid transporter
MSVAVADPSPPPDPGPPAAPATGAPAPAQVLGRLDTVFFLISAVVAVDLIGAIAVGAGQAFTWLVVLFVTFFVPSALITAELGAAIPDEGGAYVWVRTAFGRFAGGLTALLYWAGTPIWLGGSVAVVAMSVCQQFFGSLGSGGGYLFGTAFVLLATAGAVVPLRYGKWVPTSGALGQIVLLVFFTVSVAGFGWKHGLHGIGAGNLAPSAAVFIAVVPVLIYSFAGIELPSAAAGEMRDPRRDLPVAIAQAGTAQALMYGVPVLAILLVLPTGRVTSLHGLIDAMALVFTIYGGHVAADGSVTLTGAGQVCGWCGAALFIWVLLASGTAWIIGTARAQSTACLDGAGPPGLGRTSRSGVPVVMVLVTGAVTLFAMTAALVVTHGQEQKFFSAGLTCAIALDVLTYLMIFPAFLVLRRRRPELPRPFRVPGGRTGAALVCGLATGWSLLAATCLLWPGLGTHHPDRALPAGFAGQRAQFELLVLVPIVLAVLTAALFHRSSARRGPLREPGR